MELLAVAKQMVAGDCPSPDRVVASVVDYLVLA
jgi:hypothetical protein